MAQIPPHAHASHDSLAAMDFAPSTFVFELTRLASTSRCKYPTSMIFRLGPIKLLKCPGKENRRIFALPRPVGAEDFPQGWAVSSSPRLSLARFTPLVCWHFVATKIAAAPHSEKTLVCRHQVAAIADASLLCGSGVSKPMSTFKVPNTHLPGSFLAQPLKLSGNI
jgi:hypothetical protein